MLRCVDAVKLERALDQITDEEMIPAPKDTLGLLDQARDAPGETGRNI